MAVSVVQSWPLLTEPALERSCWRDDSRNGGGFDDIIGGSASLGQALALVRLVSDADTTVFLNGETGTGKELIARADSSPVSFSFAQVRISAQFQGWRGREDFNLHDLAATSS